MSDAEPGHRYLRQQQVPAIGPQVQQRLENARVAVIGAGGLGCPLLQYLAGAGIGRLTIVDPDTVALHNLHRQVLYQEAHIGLSKAETAASLLRALNSAVEILPLPEALTFCLATRLAQQHEVLVDCADSFAVTLMLDQVCRASGAALISASAVGLSGYSGAFHGARLLDSGKGAPGYRAVFPAAPGQAPDCSEAGVLGPLTGMVGSAQAAAVILLYADPSAVLGFLQSFDLLRGQGGRIDFREAPEPATVYHSIDRAMIGPEDVVVDLRSEQESPQPVVAGALRLRVEDLPAALLDHDAQQRIVLCCARGLRAWRAADGLAARQFANLAILNPWS